MNTMWLKIIFIVLTAHNLQAIASESSQPNVRYGYEKVGQQDIFYREAGDPSKQAVVLLHGFPSSSHMYRNVLDKLGDDYYLVAPDYPGFGDSSFPAREDYSYTFDQLAKTMEQFINQRGIESYVLMIHDYGAPVGFRIALSAPEKVDGFVVMNGNAYQEGIAEETWAPIIQYWKQRDNRELEQTIIDNVFSLGGMRWQYTHGTRHPRRILPDNWNIDFMKISRAGQHRVQLDLFYDYQTNVAEYPKWQSFLQKHQPPMLIVWGKNDAFFPANGALAYKKDVKDVEIHLLDTGHFALEEESEFITNKMRGFLQKIALQQ